MKILHIGDIHLGCTLENRKRNAEIERVLDHLVDYVRLQHIQAALLAGDVFDKGNPSNESQELYYRFLLNLQCAGCRQVIVIAGNHDSSNFLDAPQALLKQMDIHIIGNISPEHLEKEVIVLGNHDAPEAYVCAVPYLNERDVHASYQEGESAADRDAAVARGIEQHYRDVFQMADRKRNGRAIPIIGMGHLYAAGSTFAVSNDEAPTIGNLTSVELAHFAGGYAYMALGHLHKPQTVSRHETWRYAGSILPMNLRDNSPTPQVVLIDTADTAHPVIHELPTACFHEMKVIRGSVDDLRNQLNELHATGRDIWVKAIYTGSDIRPNWSIDLRQEFRDSKAQIIISEIQQRAPTTLREIAYQQPIKPLSRMTPEELFLMHLDKKGDITDSAQRELYLKLFRESLSKTKEYNPAEDTEKGNHDSGIQGVMKFERLYIKNVNSLYGENVIDFTDSAFDSGIFLISGNTGSGKSSILDAICLALFGVTPRATVSASQDCVMSQGTCEVRAELTFSLNGISYCACFLHKRTKRRDADKSFANIQRALYKNGILESRLATEVNHQIRELIGLDQKQFCQCVLLAQGGFDAFLKANDNDRADILKNITGTERYSAIGRQINADYTEVKNSYDAACQALRGITLMTQEERIELQNQENTIRQQLRNHLDELKQKEAAETLFETAEQAEKEYRKAAEAVAIAEKKSAAAQQMRQELEDAHRAANCENSFRETQSLRNQLQELQKKSPIYQQQRQSLEKQKKAADRDYAEIEQRLADLTEEQRKAGELFQIIRALDNQLENLTNEIRRADKELTEARSRLKKQQQEFREAERTWQAVQRRAGDAKAYCDSHRDDQRLPELKAIWELRSKQLVEDNHRNAEERVRLDACRIALHPQRDALSKNQKRLSDLKEKMASAVAELDKCNKQMEALLLGKSLQELQENRTAALKLDELFKDAAQRREYLSPGKRCPLCGSLQHPYVEGTPIPDSREFEGLAKSLGDKIGRIEALQLEIRKREAAVEKFTAECHHLQEMNTIAEAALGKAEAAEQEQTKTCETHRHETAEKAAALTKEVQAILQIVWTDFSSLPEELDNRIASFETATESLHSLTEERNRYEKACGIYAALNPQNEKLVAAKQAALAGFTGTLASETQRRRELFADKEVATEEKRIAAAVEESRSHRDRVLSASIKLQEQLSQTRRELEECLQKQTHLSSALKSAEEEFSSQLQQCGFSSQDDFASKRRDPQHTQRLSAEIQIIDNKLNIVKGAKAACQKIYEESTSRLPANTLRSENLQQLQQLQESSKEIQSQLDSLTLKLKMDEEARKRYAHEEKRIAELRTSCNHWKYLDDNFGSASADRFGRIAQGYTFSELLVYANQNRLQSLKNHFTLINDGENPLELNVIDHYRGGLIRTSRNLSGGECFEISLALALGLAEMSSISQKASLGNVLLDEGFGTLDDTALDSALELLTQLRQKDRKLVGVISHVAKLKERIDTQITVMNTDGMGSLSGAGIATLQQAAGSATFLETSKKCIPRKPEKKGSEDEKPQPS